jgi:hypothetical protein
MAVRAGKVIRVLRAEPERKVFRAGRGHKELLLAHKAARVGKVPRESKVGRV